MLADVTSNAVPVADGFVKYGPYIWGLALALAALAFIFVVMLLSKNAQIRRAEKQTDEKDAQLAALQERRLADRDTFQTKLDALAREMVAATNESAKSYFEMRRTVEDKIPDPRKRAPPKDDPIFERNKAGQ